MQLAGPENYDAISDALSPINNPDILHAVITINNKKYHLPSNTLTISWNLDGHWNVHHNFIYYDTDNSCLSQGYWGIETADLRPNQKSELFFSVYLSGSKLTGQATILIVLRDKQLFMLPMN